MVYFFKGLFYILLQIYIATILYLVFVKKGKSLFIVLLRIKTETKLQNNKEINQLKGASYLDQESPF